MNRSAVVLISTVIFCCALVPTATAAYESWHTGDFKIVGYDDSFYRQFYPYNHKIGDLLAVELDPGAILLLNVNSVGNSIYAYLLFQTDGAPVYWFHLSSNGEIIEQDLLFASCAYEKVEVPLNQFNIGDSIGEGEAANGTIGAPNHQTVWSTGYLADDPVDSLNERLENTNAAEYYENDALRDPLLNHAVSGAVMADFAGQASDIVSTLSSGSVPDPAGMITILLGNNDVCAASLETMTDPVTFENQYRAGLDVLAASSATSSAYIHVSSIPAIYWLWNAKRADFWCRVFVWPFVPCGNLLDNPADDCASDASREDPDTIYADDGENCVRRKTFHAKIKNIYNPILKNVLHEYRDNGKLSRAYFIDAFDVQFDASHVNNGDCFHPSETGHALLSDEEWCRSLWGGDKIFCTQ